MSDDKVRDLSNVLTGNGLWLAVKTTLKNEPPDDDEPVFVGKIKIEALCRLALAADAYVEQNMIRDFKHKCMCPGCSRRNELVEASNALHSLGILPNA